MRSISSFRGGVGGAKRYNQRLMAAPRKPARLFAIAGTIAALAVAAAWTASAQTSKSIGAGQQRLHEDVLPPTGARAAIGVPAVFGDKPGEGKNPSAFASGSKILPKPSKDATKGSGEPVLGRGGVAADRDTQTRPDYQTGTDQTLQYVTVFNPSVIPFKRMSALDRVRKDYTLYTESRVRSRVRVGGKRSAGRDLFWGSVVIQLKTGDDIAIPSVAPDMRILSYELSPKLGGTLKFSKDDADNYFVRTEESGVSGTYRLVFLADADARHFTGETPVGYTVRDVTRRGKAHVNKPPASVQRVADRALRKLGVSPHMDFKKALDKLVAYFRNYEATDKPPPSTGDIYWDLFTSQAGVCRHRSFVFAVTANALGIPTRYVTNEAHAWVEVWVPEVNWIRIDLGGAALRMDVSNAKDKTIYRPRQKDSFPKPDKYSNNYTQLRGDIKGLTPDQIKEGQADNSNGSKDGKGGNDPDGKGDPDATPDWNLDDPDKSGTGDPGGPQIGPGRSLPPAPDDNKLGAAVTVDASVSPVGYRGESVKISGRLTDDAGVGIPDMLVDIWLSPSGRRGDDERHVGVGMTDSDGKYKVDVELPKDMILRSYDVYATTGGNKKYSPARSPD